MADFIEIRSSDKDTPPGPGLDEIAREGARRILAQALEAEVAMLHKQRRRRRWAHPGAAPLETDHPVGSTIWRRGCA